MDEAMLDAATAALTLEESPRPETGEPSWVVSFRCPCCSKRRGNRLAVRAGDGKAVLDAHLRMFAYQMAGDRVPVIRHPDGKRRLTPSLAVMKDGVLWCRPCGAPGTDPSEWPAPSVPESVQQDGLATDAVLEPVATADA